MNRHSATPEQLVRLRPLELWDSPSLIMTWVIVVLEGGRWGHP
jgi:hypothetical protein